MSPDGPRTTEPTGVDPADVDLFRALREMWETHDPVPDDLAERISFTLELENLEFELLTLNGVLEPVGARGASPDVGVTTMTFGGDEVSLMITVSAESDGRHRVDGWIAPAAILDLEVRTSAETRRTQSDAQGRFVIEDVPSGLIQIVIHPTPGAPIELARPVVTPAVHV